MQIQLAKLTYNSYKHYKYNSNCTQVVNNMFMNWIAVLEQNYKQPLQMYQSALGTVVQLPICMLSKLHADRLQRGELI